MKIKVFGDDVKLLELFSISLTLLMFSITKSYWFSPAIIFTVVLVFDSCVLAQMQLEDLNRRDDKR